MKVYISEDVDTNKTEEGEILLYNYTYAQKKFFIDSHFSKTIVLIFSHN